VAVIPVTFNCGFSSKAAAILAGFIIHPPEKADVARRMTGQHEYQHRHVKEERERLS
jgi:hypothetical protein